MKYIRLIPVLLLGAMFTACNTPQHLYEAQEYDQVIQQLAPKIVYGDKNAKHIDLVVDSYHKANQADHERIQALKASGQPDVWPEIYQRYNSMKGRNDILSRFPKEVKKDINYVKLDLNEDMAVARNHAEAYLVAKANQLLSTGEKSDAFEAKKYINQLEYTNRENAHLIELGKKQAFYTAETVTIAVSKKLKLPENVTEAILDFAEGEVPFALARSKASSAMVVVNVADIEVSPQRLDEVTFEETKNGKTVSVTDHSQTKSATLKGNIEYHDADGKSIGIVPFKVKSSFKHDYTTIKGDLDACSAETLDRLNTHPVPVPTDESLILDAAKKLNDLLANELRK